MPGGFSREDTPLGNASVGFLVWIAMIDVCEKCIRKKLEVYTEVYIVLLFVSFHCIIPYLILYKHFSIIYTSQIRLARNEVAIHTIYNNII